MIAKAMVHSPPILILDEPTAGVDVNLRQLLWDSIKDLNKKGTTILLTTHYLEEAENLCKEVIMIDKGKVLIKGAIKELLKNIDLKSINIHIENAMLFGRIDGRVCGRKSTKKLEAHADKVVAPTNTCNDIYCTLFFICIAR